MTRKYLSGIETNTLKVTGGSPGIGKVLTSDSDGDATWQESSDVFFNVVDYGALGDGTTNDTQAVQDAIDAAELVGGTVYIPQGNYKVVLPQINTGGITIQGSGWKSVLILADSTLEPGGETIGLWVNGADNVVIRNLAIDGNFTNIAKSGTYANSSPLWTSIVSQYGAQSPKNYQYGSGVDMDTYLQYSACIRVTNATNVLVEGCYVYNTKSSGILVDSNTVDGTREVMIRNNRVRLTWDNGIYFHLGVKYGSAVGNHSSDTQYAGITAIYSNDILVSNNVIHDNGPSNSDSAGIEFCGVNTGIIANNTINNSLFEGILLKNTDETNLTNGHSGKFVRNYGICVLGNKISNVHDPRFPSSVAYGINVRSADKSSIEGNSIYKADYGIAVGDVATGTIINNNHIDKSYGWGMMLGDSPDIIDTKITNNIIENGLANGAVFYAPVIFRGNTVRNNAEQGIDLAESSDLPYKTDYIEYNYFADNGYNGISASAGAGNKAVIRYNEFINSDSMSFDDGSATSGSATFASATANFEASDVGSKIIITSVGSSNASDTLVTTISARTNSTTITLADNALVTRTGLSFTLFRPKNVYYDGVMAGGDPTLTSATANFTASDVGKTVILYANNGPQPSIIGTFSVSSYSSPTSVDLNASPANDSGIMFVIKRNYGKQQRAVYVSNGSDIHYEYNRSFSMNTENYNNGSISINSVLQNNYDFGSNTSNRDPLVAPLYPLVNANYTRYIGDKDMVEVIDASGGAKDVYFPDVSNIRIGKPFSVIKSDSSGNAVTLHADQNINGASTYVLSSQYDSATFVSNGSTYYAIAPKISGFVTLAGTQTLTNKTLTSPVINSPTGIVKGDVGLGNVDNTSDATKDAATSTLSNKTLTTPTIASFVNANHNHSNSAGGGTIAVSDTTGTLTVARGGTGRTTGTTAYALIATGTTATGIQQSLAAGATTEILVGGGSSALPIWTTATGSGAPVRSSSPNITTPTGIVKGDVGLGNVDNTSNATERAATATLTNKTVSGSSNTLTNIAQSSVTNLTTDLSGKQAASVIAANGMGVVIHGSNPSVSRPSGFGCITWIGTVTPSNAITDDIYYNG